MTKPQVSIIVPVYKVPEKYLRKCIESTMAQTLESIEILLVDDGSPDNCGEICDGYEEKDSRIQGNFIKKWKVYHQLVIMVVKRP